MLDQYGRNINYMRISITDRCDLRCRYCMPAEGIEKVPMSQILTYEEILRVCEAAAALGITRFKVTGGEPLVRKGCTSLVREMKRIPGTEQVTLTTNGQRLAEEADALGEAGVDGINVSLDSLRADRYRQITGGGDLEKTLRGIAAAVDSGIPTKVNCLLQQGFNEDELADFAALALGAERDIAGPDAGVEGPAGSDSNLVALREPLRGRLDVRFIEIMPIGFGVPETGLSNEAVLVRLQELFPDLQQDDRIHGNGPAVYYRRGGAARTVSSSGSVAASALHRGEVATAAGSSAAHAGGSIGLISAMHSSFCGSCNRIRLTSQGEVKPCLCYEDSISLKPALQSGSAEELQRALAEAIRRKPVGHTFGDRASVERRPMMAIGG